MRISDWSSDGCSSDLFARHGGRIAIACRKEEHRAAGVAAIEALGGNTIGVALDIRDPAQVTRAFDEIEAALGPVTLLINNAAGLFMVSAGDIKQKGWRVVTNVVLDGARKRVV